MKNEKWFELKDELIKLDVASRVELRFFNVCYYNEYKDDDNKGEWEEEETWISCPLGSLLNRERLNKLLDFRDKHDLEMEIYNGEDIRFTKKKKEIED